MARRATKARIFLTGTLAASMVLGLATGTRDASAVVTEVKKKKDLLFGIISVEALVKLYEQTPHGPHQPVIQTEREKSGVSRQVIVNQFAKWFKGVGLEGCSSHSGRRTFITNAARKISTVGGSLKDVQSLAGHSSLETTQRYIEVNSEARKRIVELV